MLENTLNGRFEEVELLGQFEDDGGKFLRSIHHVRERASGEERVVKIYPRYHDRTFDYTILEVLSSDPDLQALCEHDSVNDNGLIYVVLEYVEGENLFDLYRAGELSVKKMLKLLADLLEGPISRLHSGNLMHGDLKPDDIIYDGEKLKIVDLETVHPAGEPWNSTRYYAAPEQDPDSRIAPDQRSDIYALGMGIFHMLIGDDTFDEFRSWYTTSGNPSVAGYIAHKDLVTKEGLVPKELVPILEKATELRPRDRYQTAKEMAQDLRRLVASS